MKDLYRCLSEYPEGMLRALAEIWDVELPEGDTLAQVTALGEAMLAPERVERTIRTMSPEARRALGLLVAEGGYLPTQRLSSFGVIRRFGPARLEREQPWMLPENPLEELYYRGLVYRAYGSADAGLDEVLLIPDQLLEALHAFAELLEGDKGLQVIPDQEVRDVRSSGNDLCEDILAILVASRMGRLPSLSVADLDLGPRLVGPAAVDRLALIGRLLARLRLLRRSAGGLEPSPRAKGWLRLPDLRRHYTTFVAWRDNPRWDEMRFIEGLSLEGSPPPGRLVDVRRAIAVLLLQVPREGWITLNSFVEEARRERPDILRRQGELAWSLRDAQSGAYIDGPDTWGDVEDPLIRHMITRALHFLGVVDLATLGPEGALAVRLSEEGRLVLESALTGAKLPEAMGAIGRAAVGDDLMVTIPVAGTMYERYLLERFAEWVSQDTVATYRLTPESVWRAHNAQVNVEQIIAFLQRVSGERCPPVVSHTLHAWGGRYGRASVRRATLLETKDEATMQQIIARPELRDLLGERLTPRICILLEENTDALISALRDMGIWPDLR